MPNFKKLLATLLSVTILMTALAACDDDKKPVESGSDDLSITEPSFPDDTDTQTEPIPEPIPSSEPDVIPTAPEDTKSTPAEIPEDTSSEPVSTPDPSTTPKSTPAPDEQPSTFDEFDDEFDHFQAWIKIDNTNVNCPVFIHPTDNHFYLDHDKWGNYLKEGEIYADNRCIISGNNRSDNVIVVGHNMASLSKFATLQKYYSLDFYKNNPIVDFETKDGKEEYVILGAFFTNVLYEHDNNSRFEYYRQRNFDSQTEFNEWKNEVVSRSFFTSVFDYNIDDKYLTLQTCKSSLYDEAKLILICREVRDGEIINTSKISKNPDMYVPASWSKSRMESFLSF